MPRCTLRHFILLIGAGFFVLLLVDWSGELYSRHELGLNNSSSYVPREQSTYRLSVLAKATAVNPTKRTLQGEVIVEAIGLVPNMDILSITISISDPHQRGRTWHWKGRSDFSVQGEIVSPTSSFRHSRAEAALSFSLQAVTSRREIFYPFDRYDFLIEPLGCINDGSGACLDTGKGEQSEIQVTNFLLDLSEISNQFDVCADSKRRNSLSFSLCRESFLRWASVYFLTVSVAICWLIARSESSVISVIQSLGMFGALWGIRSLLVAETVHAFPTVIDYSVFGVFTMLLIIMVWKVPSMEK